MSFLLVLRGILLGDLSRLQMPPSLSSTSHPQQPPPEPTAAQKVRCLGVKAADIEKLWSFFALAIFGVSCLGVKLISEGRVLVRSSHCELAAA